MPEWFTPLLRVLVAMPSFGNCSTRKTSCQRPETARAMAQPTTPPPIIRMLAWSMHSEYRNQKKENRKIVGPRNQLAEESSLARVCTSHQSRPVTSHQSPCSFIDRRQLRQRTACMPPAATRSRHERHTKPVCSPHIHCARGKPRRARRLYSPHRNRCETAWAYFCRFYSCARCGPLLPGRRPSAICPAASFR